MNWLRVGPLITKKDTFYRKALDPLLKIAYTLRYMATGNIYSPLLYAFRVARNTISKFVPEVAEAIVTVGMKLWNFPIANKSGEK